MSVIKKQALDYAAAGFSVIPTFPASHPQKPKAPIGSGRSYQEKIRTEAEIERDFKNGCSLAVVAGPVSGGLECIDLDAPELYDPLWNLLDRVDGSLLDKVVIQKTPSGGYHLLYRCNGACG